jgi:hypothetical protein
MRCMNRVVARRRANLAVTGICWSAIDSAEAKPSSER